jgi:hypothetical protein
MQIETPERFIEYLVTLKNMPLNIFQTHPALPVVWKVEKFQNGSFLLRSGLGFGYTIDIITPSDIEDVTDNGETRSGAKTATWSLKRRLKYDQYRFGWL